MNILITGIHGFVGSNLVKAMMERHKIYGLDIIAPQREGVVKTYSWDELDEMTQRPEAFPAFDAVIHLAGKAHDTKNQADAQVYFEINTELTKRAFDYFLTSKASRFVFFSSVKAAADAVQGDVLTEDVVPAPKGPYGESKIEAEKYLQSRWKEAEAAQKRVYILRPCMIHGPGNKGNLNLLYGVVSKGIPWPLGSYANRRSFTSIGNLCFAVEGLLTKDVSAGVYHIGDDEALSTNELITLMCEVLGRKPHIWRWNKGLVETCAKMGTILHLPLDMERLRKLTENYVVSNAKLKQALGIDRMPVRAADGIRYTIASFKNKNLR